MAAALELDAIVLADDPLSRVRIAGLTARERASRVAAKVGASRVLVIDGSRDHVVAWRNGRTCPLLVIRADQLVHTPLVSPLVAAMPSNGVAVSVGPDGAYAGAFLAAGAAARDGVTAIANNNTAFVDGPDAVRIPHGDIARHPIATVEERKGAHKLLYRLLVKPQDNVISKYIFRPLSLPLTKLIVRTPITPNMLSLTVAAMCAIACLMTATADMRLVIAGAALQAFSGFIDCCDGETARLKLMSSKLGAWLDTIVDELSTIGYMTAVGWHCHLHWGHPGWDIWTVGIVVGLGTYLFSLYGIYYNIIVGVGSANSQDYAAKFDVVPGAEPGTVRLRPIAATPFTPPAWAPSWLVALLEFAPNMVRRDFIVWAALVMALAHVMYISFILLFAGGVISALVVAKDHVYLRALRRRVARSGQRLLPAKS